MKFENTWTGNFDGAIRGLRNPLASWEKSDSFIDSENKYFFGENDIKLAQKLIEAGPEHRKFMRQIFVSVDITAPIFWWKELSTYKVATTANSTSTMHKLASTPITLDCFETGTFNPDLEYYFYTTPYMQGEYINTVGMLADLIIEQLEVLRLKYNETKDKKYWYELVRWLPMGWLQTRTWSANYEILYSIVKQRANHKLEHEWGSFINWCTTLPYAKELIFYGDERKTIFNKYKNFGK